MTSKFADKTEIDDSFVEYSAESRCQDLLNRYRIEDGNKTDAPSGADISFISGPVSGTALHCLHFAGRFQIERLLGQGGFGTVYSAFDPIHERRVAIKVISALQSHPDELMQLAIAEAKATAKIKHKSIVQAFEVGWAGPDSIYVAMELVFGGNLKDLMTPRGIGVRQAVEVVEVVADAISIAHIHGLVHLDLKPENILLDTNGQIKIADFGLAAFRNYDLAGYGQVAGSPPYMSPEQVRGVSAEIQRQSDIWSLGVVFYELLTGSKPFQGSKNEIFDAIEQSEIIPPSSLNDRVPKVLDRICLKCLERDPKHRYRSMSHLVTELGRWRRYNNIAGPNDRPKPVARSSAKDRTFFVGSLIMLPVIAIIIYLILNMFVNPQRASPDDWAIWELLNLETEFEKYPIGE